MKMTNKEQKYSKKHKTKNNNSSLNYVRDFANVTFSVSPSMHVTVKLRSEFNASSNCSYWLWRVVWWGTTVSSKRKKNTSGPKILPARQTGKTNSKLTMRKYKAAINTLLYERKYAKNKENLAIKLWLLNDNNCKLSPSGEKDRYDKIQQVFVILIGGGLGTE